MLIAGSGNAAMCAGIAALERGSEVLMVEAAPENEAGGNTRYTAGAMRFAYESNEDLTPLLANPDDPRIPRTEFGVYDKSRFRRDMMKFNGELPLSFHQEILVERSYATMLWLAGHNVRFEPIYARQSFEKDGKHVFWGGLTLASQGEGDGLFREELKEFLRMGGEVAYATEAVGPLMEGDAIRGLACETASGGREYLADSVILASGGFEADPEKRARYIGERWRNVKTRGTPYNRGRGLDIALASGAKLHGLRDGCHAVPMDLNTPAYGNREIPFGERKNYRKICYFLGVMLNAEGKRFVDEGQNFRNFTYAQFGKAVLEQPGGLAWQIFDAKTSRLLYKEYEFRDASCVEADTLGELVEKLDGMDRERALRTIEEFNAAVDGSATFDPTVLDGKGTSGILPRKSNWANALDKPPFKAYPVTCGITFSYYGVAVNGDGAVLNENDRPIRGLYACGEMVGGVFYYGYPGGSGLTSGAVFGRIAGNSAGRPS